MFFVPVLVGTVGNEKLGSFLKFTSSNRYVPPASCDFLAACTVDVSVLKKKKSLSKFLGAYILKCNSKIDDLHRSLY